MAFALMPRRALLFEMAFASMPRHAPLFEMAFASMPRRDPLFEMAFACVFGYAALSQIVFAYRFGRSTLSQIVFACIARHDPRRRCLFSHPLDGSSLAALIEGSDTLQHEEKKSNVSEVLIDIVVTQSNKGSSEKSARCRGGSRSAQGHTVALFRANCVSSVNKKEDGKMEETQSLLVDYDRLSAEKAFAQSQDAANAVDPEQLKGLYLLQDVVTVLDEVGLLVEQAKKDLGNLVTMPTVEAKMIEELSRYRLAYWHASLEVLMSQGESKRKNIQEITQQLRSIRRRLFGGIDVVWPDDQAMQDRLAALRRGSGYADLASDVVALVGLYRSHLDEASARLQRAPLEALLEEGSRLAPLLLDTRKEEGETSDTEKKIEIQRRLFVLLEELYNEIAAAGAYVFRRDPQRAALYPPNLRNAYTRALPSFSNKPTAAKKETVVTPTPSNDPAPPNDTQ